MLLNCGAGEDLIVPWTSRRSSQSILKLFNPEYSLKGLMLKLELQYFGHLMWSAASLENTLLLGKTGGDGDDRSWMASLTQWTWVWANSERWWRTGKPGVLQSMGSQRVEHEWATEQPEEVKIIRLVIWLQAFGMIISFIHLVHMNIFEIDILLYLVLGYGELLLKNILEIKYVAECGTHQSGHFVLFAATAKSLQPCPTLCDPIDGSPPGSAVPRILQARTLEWVAISFSSAWKWKVKVKLLSRVWLFVTPWTTAYQTPPSVGFSRQEYWSGLPLSSPCTV